MIKLATLFSGVGAIEEAFVKKKIKHKIVFAADNGERECEINVDEVKRATLKMSIKEKNEYIEKLYLSLSKKENYMQKQYSANFKVQSGHYYQDVRFIDGTDYKEENIDLLVGGSPCQSFSIIGKRGGLEDTRGTLFYEYARIVKECQPKAFIYENVLGMLSHDKGRTWDTIHNVFLSLGYSIKVFKVNARDYGIPQDRKRIFVVGSLIDNKMVEPKKVPLTCFVEDYLEEKIPAKYYLGEKGFSFVTNPAYANRARINRTVMMCQKANQQFNWNGDFRFEIYDKKKHTKDIMSRAFLGEFNGQKGVARQLTPRECFRLMGFNDDYKIVVHDNMAWRQAGNAIVVNVLEAIIDEMIDKGLLKC